jgi:hypothetical protein
MRNGRFFYEGRMVIMRWMIRVWTVVFCLWAIPSQAAVLDPWAFTSLGALNASETVIVNTDTLALTGGAAYTGVLDSISGAGIFSFNGISGTNLSIFGTRPLGLLSRGSLAINGTADLEKTLDAGGRPLGVITTENIMLSGEARSGNIRLSSGRDMIVPGAGVTGRTVNLGSGIITLTGGTISGSANFGVSTVSSIGTFSGTTGMTLVEPVPVPAAFLLFATGLVALGLVKRRIS